MTTEPPQISACMVDNGLGIPLAQKLAPSFKRFLYFSEWMEAFPTLNKRIIGDGFAGIERVDDFWDHKNEIDLFIFPDIYRSGLQKELESQGKMVWGSRDGDSLEKYRGLFLRTLKEVGLSVPPFEQVNGLTALRDFLKDKEDRYIKISKYRGTFETQHWNDWDRDSGSLDILAVKLGPLQKMINFMVFEPINTEVEIGGDTFCIDGQFPAVMVNGDEYKDKGYLGAVTPVKDMPKEVQEVMEAFAPILKKERYRNMFSMEIRPPYFIDPCCRIPCPGMGAQMELIGNLPEIIVAGAQGELVQPKMTADFAAECVLTMKGEKCHWKTISFPEEGLPYVKCGDTCEIEGKTCWPPSDQHGEEVGWIWSTGNTIAETIETMKERVSLLPDGICAGTESLFELLKSIRDGEAHGKEFSDQTIPEPTTALET